MEVMKDASELSNEDQAGLATHLLANLDGMPLGPDERELERREAEMDDGTAKMLTHEELCRAVGR